MRPLTRLVEKTTGFNVGAVYDFDDHNHLLVFAGRALQNAPEQICIHGISATRSRVRNVVFFLPLREASEAVEYVPHHLPRHCRRQENPG